MAARMYICDHHNKDHHCSVRCLHGKEPHPADGCTIYEYCSIVDDLVKCKPVPQKLIKEYHVSKI